MTESARRDDTRLAGSVQLRSNPKIEVLKRDPAGRMRWLTVLADGDRFGEIAERRREAQAGIRRGRSAAGRTAAGAQRMVNRGFPSAFSSTVIPRPGRRDTSVQPSLGSGVPSAMRSFTSMLMSIPLRSDFAGVLAAR
jgi:hypothetical protein